MKDFRKNNILFLEDENIEYILSSLQIFLSLVFLAVAILFSSGCSRSDNGMDNAVSFGLKNQQAKIAECSPTFPEADCKASSVDPTSLNQAATNPAAATANSGSLDSNSNSTNLNQNAEVNFVTVKRSDLQTYFDTVGIQLDSKYEASLEPDKLQLIWQNLNAIKKDVSKFSNIVSSIGACMVASYSPAAKLLCVSPELSAQDIVQYLMIIQRRLQIENEIKIEINWGVETNQGDIQHLAIAQNHLKYLEDHKSELKSIQHMVRKISLIGFSSYYPRDRDLKILDTDFDTELNKFISSLKAYDDLFNFLDRLKIQILVENDFDFMRDQTYIPDLFLSLYNSESTLKDLMVYANLKTIRLSSQRKINYYSESVGEFAVAVLHPGRGQMVQVLNAILKKNRIGKELGIPISSNLDFDNHYADVIDKLESFYARINSKKKNIRAIRLSTLSKFDEQTDVLSIGWSDASSNILKNILDAIK